MLIEKWSDRCHHQIMIKYLRNKTNAIREPQQGAKIYTRKLEGINIFRRQL